MPAPLAHISGLLNGVLVATAGMRSVFMAKWDPEHALDLIEAERVTFMVGPPTFFIGLMSASGFSSERVASLRLISSGGAGVTPAFVDGRPRRSGAASSGPTARPRRRPPPPGPATRRTGRRDRRSGHRRRRAPTSTRQPDRVGESDELLVRGPELFVGYDDPAATEAAIDDGWFRTGDRASLDDGWLTITGRLKDVIIRGGENVPRPPRGDPRGPPGRPPRRRRRRARRAPRRAGVGVVVLDRSAETATGSSTDATIVTVAAFDLDECRRWFEAHGATRFTWPERVDVIDAIPLLGSGKPDKAALRATLAPA